MAQKNLCGVTAAQAETYAAVERAYLCGDFAKAIAALDGVDDRHPLLTDCALIAAVSAVSLDDQDAFDRALARMQTASEQGERSATRATLYQSLICASMFAPSLVCERIARGETDSFGAENRQLTLYARAKYLQVTRRYDAMLELCGTYLAFEGDGDMIGVYMRVMQAVGLCTQGRRDEAAQGLARVMARRVPEGWLTPFVENIATTDGLIEEIFERDFPHSGARQQWERTWRSWMSFHNRYAHAHIDKLLSLRELSFATLAARGLTNQQIAAQTGYSLSYVKKVLSAVYERLGVQRRSELAPFVIV